MSGKPRVLVTRPQPGAARSAEALRKAGFEPVLFPLTEITPLDVDEALIDATAGADAGAATSINALCHAPDALIAALARKPMFAVGDATAEVARRRGLADVRSADGNAQDLARLIVRKTLAGARIACLCGRVRTGVLEADLRRGGRTATIIEIYDLNNVSHLTDKWAALPDRPPLDAILVHSGVAAEALAPLLDRPEHRQSLENTVIVAISRRVANALERRASASIHVPSQPRDDAMIALLGEIVGTR